MSRCQLKRTSALAQLLFVLCLALRLVGTDALSGMHGRNAEEFIHHVRDSGVDPMAAMISAIR